MGAVFRTMTAFGGEDGGAREHEVEEVLPPDADHLAVRRNGAVYRHGPETHGFAATDRRFPSTPTRRPAPQPCPRKRASEEAPSSTE